VNYLLYPFLVACGEKEDYTIIDEENFKRFLSILPGKRRSDEKKGRSLKLFIKR